MKQNQRSLVTLVGWTGLVKYALLALFSPVASALFALSLQPIVDTGLSGDGAAFGWACLGAAFWCGADLLLYHGMQRCRRNLIHRCTCRLRQAYMRLLLEQRPGESASHLSMLTDHAPLIAQDYLGSVLDIYRCIWSLAASLGVLAMAGWELAVLVLVCALLSVSLPKCFQRRSTQAQQGYLEASREHLAQAQESLDHGLLIRLYHLRDRQLRKYQLCAQRLERQDNVRQGVRLALDTLVMGMGQFSFLLLLAGATFLVIQGKLSVGYTMSMTQLLGSVMAPMELLPGHWMALRTGRGQYREDVEQLEGGRQHPGSHTLDHPPRTLSLQQVTFAYPGRPPIFQDLSLTLDCGKKYALVGESGCGKSTLAKLLLGFLTPTQGMVAVDGIALEEVEPRSLYGAVGYLGQSASFFHDTVAENILLGRSLSPEDWERLLHQVRLKNWVDGLPQGDRTLVERRGNNLSGGQAQRLALARCLVDCPAFLVLDEVTAALDPQTAAQLEDTVLGLKGVGVLAVTHRITPESMSQYDVILCLKDGVLTEQGTWEELMARRGAFYRLASHEIHK